VLHNSSRCKKTQLPKLPPLQTWSLKIKLHLLFFFPSRDSHSPPPPHEEKSCSPWVFFRSETNACKKFLTEEKQFRTQIWVSANQNSKTRIPTDPLHPSFQDARREKISILYSHTPAPATAIREDENLNHRNIFREKISILSPAVPKQNLSNPKSF